MGMIDIMIGSIHRITRGAAATANKLLKNNNIIAISIFMLSHRICDST